MHYPFSFSPGEEEVAVVAGAAEEAAAEALAVSAEEVSAVVAQVEIGRVATFALIIHF